MILYTYTHWHIINIWSIICYSYTCLYTGSAIQKYGACLNLKLLQSRHIAVDLPENIPPCLIKNTFCSILVMFWICSWNPPYWMSLVVVTSSCSSQFKLYLLWSFWLWRFRSLRCQTWWLKRMDTHHDFTDPSFFWMALDGHIHRILSHLFKSITKRTSRNASERGNKNQLSMSEAMVVFWGAMCYYNNF